MKIIKTKKDLHKTLESYRIEKMKIAFVPTMGALHEGHLSLIKRAKELADVVVTSIFVNPTQFNDPEDLKKYPKPIEKDVALLEAAACDVLFLPEVEEMYGAEEEMYGAENSDARHPQENEDWRIELGSLGDVLEGKERPGHFEGVVQIVYKLFKTVQPDVAVFGQKDLQQYLIIESLIQQKHFPIQLVMGPTQREANGLALSSRNVRLSDAGKEKALILSQTLKKTHQRILDWKNGANTTLAEIRALAIQEISQVEGVELAYFAICDRATLLDANEHTPPDQLVGLVAAWVEGVRLIDNWIF